MNKNRWHITLLAALLFAGCSTQNTKWANVQYHNITCHYNVWWNGNESLKEGHNLLEHRHVDDFTQIIPVYKLGTKENAMTVNSQMDKAIEKGVKGIQKHSIYQHGREYVKYVKNCYLLTAYGSFYKQDYAATQNTCRLIISQFGGTKEADEAKILMARCMTLQKQYVDAETALDQLMNENSKGEINGQLVDKLYLAMVECCLPQEKYKKTVQYIRLALDETYDNAVRARLYFIMGQIYQKLDKRPTATKYFQKVLKCHPDYIMEFNSRINIASCADEKSTNLAEREKDMDRMLKDRKNEEFRDQIYYAKGEMYLGVKDAQKACDNFKLSVEAAKNNPAQKAKSALRMAEVLYEVYENYDQAQSYYDTAMHIINIEYPNYDAIRDRYNLLTSLVDFTRVIDRNDSLLALADMDPAAREALIKNKIAELKQKEEEMREKAMLEEMRNESRAQANTLEGDWYFYNHNTVNKGKETFRQRWGNRMLEDYWFLSKKGVLGMGMSLIPNAGFEDEVSESNVSDSLSSDSLSTSPTLGRENPNDPHNVAYYLKDMPRTQGQRDTMHSDIARSLLNAGFIYYDGIKNTDRALECYLRMTNDYPDNPDIVQAFYQLYRIYSAQGNTPNANYYRDMVLMGFPDCDYANLLRDDQYYLELIRRTERAKEDYASVYSLYRRRRYTDVLQRVQTAQQIYSDKEIQGKFEYWKGLALAQTGSRDSAIHVFEGIMKEYPDTSQLYKIAENQLAYFQVGDSTKVDDEEITAADEARAKGGNFGVLAENFKEDTKRKDVSDEDPGNVLPPASQVYRYRENQEHYCVVALRDKKIVATALQYKIADFNAANYSNSGYRSQPLMFTDTTQLITIHIFKDANEAMNYYTHLLMSPGPLSIYDPQDFVVFVISKQNYSTFYKQKDIQAYMTFFNHYYKK